MAKSPSKANAHNQGTENETNAVKNAVDDFELTLTIASENDLFTKQTEIGFNDLENSVKKAQLALAKTPPDIIKARLELAKGYNSFNTAVKKAGLLWRIQYAYAIPYFLYLIVVLAIILWLAVYRRLPSTTLIPVPKRAFMWGMIGSILQGFWWLWGQVSDRHFRKSWITWFLAVPFIGALLGGIMYLAFLAGFISATKSTLQDATVPLLLAALAGFSWRWAIGVLNNLTKLFTVAQS